jgi:N-acyl-phosphatidylethanolamine-hydrolysing phospholipase D
MRARPFLMALTLLLCGTFISGCFFGSFASQSAGQLFASPRKVKKLDDPIDKDARLAVLWIGHATALIQIDDKVILTDPVFTSTVGQFSKRLVEPGLDPDKLPKCDAVLISHMHFDHLSLGSLAEIEKKVRMLLMPHGGVSYLTDFDFPVIELGTWQAWEKDGLRVTAVPVDHVAYRYGLDDAWAKDSFTGYVIEYHGIKVYFGGDTAYDQKLFGDAALHFPGLEVALLPISPIEPRDFMRRVHMDPREALQAFFDLGAKHMVPIHYDTFINSTDTPGDALRELGAAENATAKRWSLGKRDIVPIAIGERHVFLKKGEGPPIGVSDVKPADDLGWSTPAPASTTAPKPAAPKAPPPKNDIPDDDKLD